MEVWGVPHVLGGTTPCTNFTGNNRDHSTAGGGRLGFDGRDSGIFHNFVEVLQLVSHAATEQKEREEGVRAGPSRAHVSESDNDVIVLS